MTRMVLDAPVPVKIASTRRRFERFLANDRVDPVQISRQLARSLMQPWQRQTIRLFIDETALGPWLLCMKVSVGYRGRALPLAWVCYEPGKLPATQPEIVELLLRQMHQCLPRDAKVVLMADPRGPRLELAAADRSMRAVRLGLSAAGAGSDDGQARRWHAPSD